MTHEELIERVAEGIHRKRQASKYGGSASWSLLGEGTRNAVRRQAREAIRITGEALLDRKQRHGSSLLTGPTVRADLIRDITQGNKT